VPAIHCVSAQRQHWCRGALLTAFAPEERAASQILQSANDYLIKGQLSPGTLMRSIKVAGKCQGLQ
jgi:hypothetical protein